MPDHKTLPLRISTLVSCALLSGNCLALEPSLVAQRQELEAKTKTIQQSAARERQRIEELKKLIAELSKNNKSLDRQLHDKLQMLEKALGTPLSTVAVDNIVEKWRKKAPSPARRIHLLN